MEKIYVYLADQSLLASWSSVDSSVYRDYATVVAACVALLVFILNSFLHTRNERIENIARFIESHRQLFATGGYLASNLKDIDSDELKRDPGDAAMEARFHRMLIEIEYLAILANNKAVPRSTQVYMFGYYARKILPIVSESERNNITWELALAYIEKLAKDSSNYERLPIEMRRKFWT
jgi:hypothetical protein